MSKRSWQKLAAGKSQGFTLIELLIVIAIISILTLLAMANYTNIQRQARLDFSADSLVSAIREQQVLARSGKVISETVSGSSEIKNQCFALKFKKAGSSDTGLLSTGQSNYIGLPSGLSSGETIDSCMLLSDADWQQREIFDSGIKLLNVKKNCGDQSDLQEIYFKPPYGQIWNKDPAISGDLLKAQFQFEIGVPNEVASSRFVQYNVNTGEVKRIEKDACAGTL